MPISSEHLPALVQTCDQLNDISRRLVELARTRGATDAIARSFEMHAFEAGIHRGQPEILKRVHTQGLSLTVFNGLRCGTSSSTDLSDDALVATLEAAWDIAKYTDEDACNGPADAEWLEKKPADLDLFHPWTPSVADALKLASRVDDAARAVHPAGITCDSASIRSSHSQFSLATSRDFLGGYARSLHGIDCSIIAADRSGMQAATWGRTRTSAHDLDTPEQIGQRAAERAVAMLGARKIPTGTWPVLFDASIAASLIGSLVAAVSGTAIYRSLSFLPGSLGRTVLADHLTLHETPHEWGGVASAPFDAEGVATRTRDIVRHGVLQSYFLSSYSARKLGMASTGHAGGPHNLTLASDQDGGNFPTMLRRLDRGLVVTALLGNGVNLLTGDYSRGASGFWVENGQIVHPVHEVTIAGNLKEMLLGIVAVGNDIHAGPLRTGSILIDRLRIAGL